MTIKDQLRQCFSFPTQGYLMAAGIAPPMIIATADKLGLEFPESLMFALIVSLILGGLMRYHRKKRYGDI